MTDEDFYAKPVTRDFGRVDELFYFNGTWILHKPVPFAPPKFDFDGFTDPRARQMHRDLLWSMSIAPSPLSLIQVTGV